MPAADQFVVHADVGILAAAQDDRAFFKGNLLELVLRVEYNQVRPHLCDGEFDGVATGNCSVHVLHKCSVVHSKCSKKMQLVDPLPRYRLVEDDVSGDARGLFLSGMTFRGKLGAF